MMEVNWKQIMNLKGYRLLLIFLLMMPAVFSEIYLDADVDKLFLLEEGVDFFVKINNPSEEAFEGRLLVELIGLESNIKLLEEELYLYPGGAYLESLREGVTKEGEYGIRIVLKDSNFENVLEQKLLNFRVVRDCFGRDVCSYEEAYKKCNICRGGSSNTIFWILGGFIGFGTILMLYFDFKRRRLT